MNSLKKPPNGWDSILPSRTSTADSVSVVIATYNRPDALVTAIQSIQSQTVSVREIIVVGDCCDEDTAEAIATFNDDRIRYVNLRERWGDQAYPNAVGVELATSEWIAFLNHDDVWFPHHVETLMANVRATGRRWTFSAAIFSEGFVSRDGSVVPLINQVDLKSRTMWEAYGATLRYLEPVSNWLICREGLLRSGNWQRANESIRTPASRLALRLWRVLGPPAVSDEATVLKIQSALQKILGNDYHSPSELHRGIRKSISDDPTGWFTDLPVALASKQSRRASLESNWPDLSIKPLPRIGVVLCGVLFRITGFDFLEWRLREAGVRPGVLMDEMLKGRTGEVRTSWKSPRVGGSRDIGN